MVRLRLILALLLTLAGLGGTVAGLFLLAGLGVTLLCACPLLAVGGLLLIDVS